MEFSADIWDNIFSYFHSSYKKPTHLDAIMKLESFKKRVKLQREICPLIAFDNKTTSIFDSFYMSVLLKQVFYDTCNDSIRHLLLRPDIRLNINPTNTIIKHDFLNIVDNYRTNGFWNPGNTVDIFQYIWLYREHNVLL